jgi:cytoskeletal protein RodZ
MDAAGYVTPEEVRLALRKLHSEDIETNPKKALRQAFVDDLKPVDERGRWKPSSLVILVGFLICALLGVFLYFSLGRSL